MNSKNKNSLLEVLAIVIAGYLMYSVIGMAIGGVESQITRENGKDGCVYMSYLPYTNGGYLFVCELSRVRFNKEQPIELVPTEVKKI